MNEMLESMLHEVEALPEEQQARIMRVIQEEVSKAKREAAAPPDRWAKFAERMAREAPMKGKSEAFLRRVREFRDNFDLRGGRSDD
jgi:hypothetical protein